jgi:ribosome-binding protein aMBF1 (putative translation factor)
VAPRGSENATNTKKGYFDLQSEIESTTMRKAKQDRLEKRGWKVGSVDEFLDLIPEELAYIELKLRLSDNLRTRRTRKNLSQKELAALIKSSQSRVAKMEGGDPTVSIDLLVKTLFVLGASNRDLANVIAARTHSPSG